MFQTAQYASPRAKTILSRQATKSIPSAASTQPRASQQSRYLSGFHLRNRQRVLAYRNTVSVSRQLSQDNSSKSNGAKSPTENVADALLKSSKTHPSGKYTNVRDVQSWSDDVSAIRPSRSVDELEAIHQLLQRDTNLWAPLQSIRNSLKESRSSEPVTAENVLRATAGDELNYIDPITNRRISQTEHGQYSASATRELTPEEASKQYTDLGDYKPQKWNEPDGLLDMTPEERSKLYDDLPQYLKIKIDNPDQLRELTPEERSKLYDDLHKYKPQTWNEPDGLPKATPEEQSKIYDDLDKYGPVRWNEPDGLQEETPEEKTKHYQDLHQYSGAVTWNEPDGLRMLTPEEKSKQYEDLDAYSEPFVAKDSVLKAHEKFFNDPTPKAEPIPKKTELKTEPTVTEYEDLDKYGPVRWNEPDGLRLLTPEEKSKEYEDLYRYDQYPNAGPTIPRVHPEEASKMYKDLPLYEAFPNNGPLTERIHPEEASKRYEDLHKYAIDGYEEPEKTTHVHPEELTKFYTDLDKYQPQFFDNPDTPYPMHPEEATKAYKDLHSYKTAPPDVETLEGLSDAVAAGLKLYDSKVKRQINIAALAAKHHRPDITSAEPLTADGIRAQVMSRATAGNIELPDKGDVEISSMDESFPSEIFKPDSESIERITNKLAKMRAEYDPYSNDPKGLETSYSEECGKETQPALVKHYETAIPPAEKKEPAEEPATFKILAYDPATQSISMAEATSGSHGNSTPPKLADILLQLSHPSKFLPYFQSLQEHGYDIVSGGGDVLIFRKNRPPAPDAGEFPSSTINTAHVNPIDMMGRPVSGNFASPTGYVNYDNLEDSHFKPSPPYRSNINTVNQASAQAEPAPLEKKKKRSFGRKVVIGTVWVGGVAYAVGALGELLSR